ncbi:hypothetical protein Strop_0143 [Salinispora tropica CNB-440]|uniref:Uncharacterized protein n=1 Tax=Salinispora tropica (strain ATCC BAA-916 / DSM 44818 / JCM 13857 / NBRC 105044 / CNB-440) TaxID=369723 RepID=A4X178_SALTO|nr:hypothetical protein Strop_0143 [Salinispora tropica CNB-440]
MASGAAAHLRLAPPPRGHLVTAGLPFGVGSVVQLAEQHYCYGLGTLTLRIVEVGRRVRRTDGLWIHMRGVQLGSPPRQRRVLARLDAIQTQPVPIPVTHIPVRPGWDCAGCGAAWPCPDRRRRLLDRYAGNPAALGIYLSTQMTAAVPDLRHLPPEELYERFLGWLRLA